MDIRVFLGEWMATMSGLMENSSDEDVFYLPTMMHLHAFEVLRKSNFQKKKFNVQVCPHE
jgi:hypothetical protein